MSIANTIKSYLSKHKVEFDLVLHSKTFSSHDSAEAAHVADDHIAKAVIIKDEKGYAMVVIPGSNWVKLQALDDELNRKFELAEESEVNLLFKDCEPGAIPPLGPAYGLETFLDQQLTTLANIYFEAGDHKNLVHVHGEEFHSLFKGARHGYFSHND